MIKAVFLDWFTTLSRFEPSRESLYREAFAELGYKFTEEQAARGILLGDEYLYTENMKTPLAQLPAAIREDMYLCFPKMIAQQAKTECPPAVYVQVREKVRKPFGGATYVLFDDVLPAVRSLKEKGLTVGLITNLKEDINVYTRRLGLEPYLAFALTSQQVGFAKPHPRIFQLAIEKAGVRAEESVFVGDQYKIDVVGARGVGIIPVLIDRYDLYPNVTDCPRIRTLPEIEKHLS